MGRVIFDLGHSGTGADGGDRYVSCNEGDGCHRVRANLRCIVGVPP